VRLGRLTEAQRLELEYVETMEIAGYTLLDIDAACSLRADHLAGEHRDPFDRHSDPESRCPVGSMRGAENLVSAGAGASPGLVTIDKFRA
jgi:hypothetical protein